MLLKPPLSLFPPVVSGAWKRLLLDDAPSREPIAALLEICAAVTGGSWFRMSPAVVVQKNSRAIQVDPVPLPVVA